MPSIVEETDSTTGKVIRRLTKEQALLKVYNDHMDKMFSDKTPMELYIEKLTAGMKNSKFFSDQMELNEFRRLNDPSIDAVEKIKTYLETQKINLKN